MTDTETPNPLIKDVPADNTVHRNASWGAIISITIILAMVIIGAFYSWGQRISQVRATEAQAQSQ